MAYRRRVFDDCGTPNTIRARYWDPSSEPTPLSSDIESPAVGDALSCAGTPSSSKLLFSLPVEILGRIFRVLFREQLWNHCVEATFYRFLKLQRVVRTTLTWMKVCSRWATVIRNLVFTIPARRDGVFFFLNCGALKDSRVDFPRLQGVLLCLGSPNDVEALGQFHRSLGSFTSRQTLDCISAVTWRDQKHCLTDWRLSVEEPCRHECLAAGHELFIADPADNENSVERHVNPMATEFLTKQLWLYARYQAQLILSILVRLGSPRYLELPSFLFTTLALHTVTSGPEPSPSLTIARHMSESSELCNVEIAPLIKSASHVEVIVFPHPLHRLYVHHMTYFAPRSNIPRTDAFGTQINTILTRDVSEVCKRADFLGAMFHGLTGFGLRGVEVPDDAPEGEIMQSMLQALAATRLQEFQLVHSKYAITMVKGKSLNYLFFGSMYWPPADMDVRSQKPWLFAGPPPTKA